MLVVEDNPDMNRFVAECLSRDYDVATAFDGRDGLEQALRFNPMVVVSDIMMPHVSGVEMVAQMRARPELRQTPILLLSAKADEALMVQLLDHGAQDFIVKPFSERDLLVRVRNLVLGEQAREATELQKRLLHSVFMQAPLLIAVLRGPEHVIELANPPMCEQIWQRPESELLNRPLFDVIPELGGQVVRPLLRDVYETGVPYVGPRNPGPVRARRRRVRDALLRFRLLGLPQHGRGDRRDLRRRLRRDGAGDGTAAGQRTARGGGDREPGEG